MVNNTPISTTDEEIEDIKWTFRRAIKPKKNIKEKRKRGLIVPLFLAYQYVIYRCVQQPAQSIQVVDSRKALPLLCQAVDNFFLNFFLPLHYTSFRQDFYRKLIHSSLIVTVVKLPAKFYSLIGIYYYSFKPYIQKFIRNLCNFRLSFPFLFVYTG